MITAVSHAPPPQPVERTTEAAPKKQASYKSAPAAHQDTVELSPTAQAALSAMRETAEDHAPTHRPKR